MAGLGIVISRTGPGAGPVIPTQLFQFGPAGAVSRYAPERIATAVGQPIVAIPDAVSGPDLVSDSSQRPQPVLAELGGRRIMSFPSAAALAGTARMIDSTAHAGTRTMALVVKSSAKGPYVATIAGLKIARAANGQWSVVGLTAGGSLAVANTSAVADGWVVLVMSFNATTAIGTLTVNDVTGVSPAALTPSALASLTLGGYTIADGATLDIAQAAEWDRVLTDAERAQIVADARAYYSFLV